MRRAAQGKRVQKQRSYAIFRIEKLLIGKSVLIKDVAEHDVTELGHDTSCEYGRANPQSAPASPAERRSQA